MSPPPRLSADATPPSAAAYQLMLLILAQFYGPFRTLIRSWKILTKHQPAFDILWCYISILKFLSRLVHLCSILHCLEWRGEYFHYKNRWTLISYSNLPVKLKVQKWSNSWLEHVRNIIAACPPAPLSPPPSSLCRLLFWNNKGGGFFLRKK